MVGIRNGWLISGQSFLFAAYGAALAVQAKPGDFFAAANSLYLALPWIGIALAFLAFAAVNAALHRSNCLCTDYIKLGKKPEDYPEIRPSSPKMLTAKLAGHSVARSVALVFVGAWIYLLVAR